MCRQFATCNLEHVFDLLVWPFVSALCYIGVVFVSPTLAPLISCLTPFKLNQCFLTGLQCLKVAHWETWIVQYARGVSIFATQYILCWPIERQTGDVEVLYLQHGHDWPVDIFWVMVWGWSELIGVWLPCLWGSAITTSIKVNPNKIFSCLLLESHPCLMDPV